MIIYDEVNSGYYKEEHNGKSKTRINENANVITSEEIPIMDGEEQKKDDEGNLMFNIVYTATPIEGYVNPETRKSELVAEMHIQIARKDDVKWQLAKDEYDSL